MKKEEMKTKLIELFPNKKVEGISTKNQFLYREIKKYAEERNMNWVDMLSIWGYEWISQQARDEEIKNELLKMYPDLVVKNLRLRNVNLYNVIVNRAAKKGIKITERFKELGFEYISKNDLTDEKYLKSELEKYYPEKNTAGISSNHLNLYRNIKKLADSKQMTWRDLLNDWGYQTNSEHSDKVTFNLEDALKECFPTKDIFDLKTNTKIYREIRKMCLKEGVSIPEKIFKLGYNLKDKNFIQDENEKIKMKLLEMFPNKQIDKAYKIESELYMRIKKAAADEDKDWKSYLTNLGFQV